MSKTASVAQQNSIFDSILKELKHGKVRPWYCFTGTESFYLDRLQDEFDKLIPAEVKDFNFDLLYGRETRIDKILAAVRSFPMMAEKRLVIVRGFLSVGENADDDDEGEDGKSTSSKKAEASGNLNDLIPYLENPNKSTILVMVDQNGKIPGNKKFGKVIKDSSIGFSYHFEKPGDSGLTDWVTDWAKKKHSGGISPDAAMLLVENVGDNLSALSTEIDKLCTFKNTSEPITQDDVKKIVGETRQFSADELKKALFSRNREKALYIAEHILQSSTNVTGDVIRLLAFFNTVFLNLWVAKSMAERGSKVNEIAEAISPGKPNVWLVNMSLADAKMFNSIQLQQILEWLVDAGAAVKGFSRMDVRSVFLMLVTKISTA
jgi:DNA polymerase-3 subunit delta